MVRQKLKLYSEIATDIQNDHFIYNLKMLVARMDIVFPSLIFFSYIRNILSLSSVGQDSRFFFVRAGGGFEHAAGGLRCAGVGGEGWLRSG
jgi:hypothetical protein